MPEFLSVVPKTELPKIRELSKVFVPEADMLLTEIQDGIETRFEGPEYEVETEGEFTPVVGEDSKNKDFSMDIKAGSMAEMVHKAREVLHRLRKSAQRKPASPIKYKLHNVDEERDSKPHTIKVKYRVRKLIGKDTFVWKKLPFGETDLSLKIA